jgi:hypothetical protein
MKGAGLGVGEPPEAAWSHLGPWGHILQYHSLPARQATLERVVANWNAAKMLALPALLGRLFNRASLRSDESSAEACELHAAALQDGFQPDQARI